MRNYKCDFILFFCLVSGQNLSAECIFLNKSNELRVRFFLMLCWNIGLLIVSFLQKALEYEHTLNSINYWSYVLSSRSQRPRGSMVLLRGRCCFFNSMRLSLGMLPVRGSEGWTAIAHVYGRLWPWPKGISVSKMLFSSLGDECVERPTMSTSLWGKDNGRVWGPSRN